ncbi:hypothetical protein MAR_014122 [Mya arenaria]|uniref:Uncharacterized protein n=1 Tax=Mya arenaria TaxID=6604 RepID=A0ABY7G5H9_MYAAR|nr:hypothetical protein MAR_014122 [Mya arenaria]
MLLTEFPIPNVGVHHKEDNVQTYIDVDGMFTALSNCQILHPDPEEVDYDENVDDAEHRGPEDGGQFDDADMEQ